jgi:transposase-like protein
MRFTLSYRDVEDLLAERGLDISYGHRQLERTPGRRKAIFLRGEVRR